MEKWNVTDEQKWSANVCMDEAKISVEINRN